MILDEAMTDPARVLIVFGSRGLIGAHEAADGSGSHEIATHAGRPTLVVPRPQTNAD